jgi:hypothetical protein
MLLSRECRYRIPVVAVLLLGLLSALAVCSTAAHAGASRAQPAASATSGPVQAPGCDKGATDDGNGARPATLPRGGSAHELLPSSASGGWGGHGCVGRPADGDPDRGRAQALDREPPPLARPSPVDLSVLRV